MWEKALQVQTDKTNEKGDGYNQRNQKFRGGGRDRGRGQFRGHDRGNLYQWRGNNYPNNELENNNNSRRHNIQCRNCKKMGYYKSECQYNSDNKGRHANMIENNGEKNKTILFSSSGVEENKKNNWFLDSG